MVMSFQTKAQSAILKAIITVRHRRSGLQHFINRWLYRELPSFQSAVLIYSFLASTKAPFIHHLGLSAVGGRLCAASRANMVEFPI